ncbi:MAG TPA: hypothetical protein VMP01_07925 [Pirellulaceae bacterium]|nr:hypothetical protein [Pirellulaceae bacterium]
MPPRQWRLLGTLQKQQGALLNRVWPMLGYRVRVRMQQRHFPADDRLYRMVVEARVRMHSLTVELHHMSCQGGVGRPGRQG